MRPKLLDLFCGAGGCSVGYNRAGFDVTGVDIAPHHSYPFMDVVQDDAMLVLTDVDYIREEFDAVHASPPCQAYTVAQSIHAGIDYGYPDLVDPVREALLKIGLPYVIENVPGAPLIDPVMLCGQSFGLGVFRHRLFETNWPLVAPPHEAHRGKVGDGKFFTVAGHGYGRSIRDGISLGGLSDWQSAMGIDWMRMDALAQAIPPAYTEHIGTQLIAWMSEAAA